jgi:16S rRNA (cytosine967-C5)-methyltransferase
MEKKVATQIIHKYLKKGNMARCLRDILPSAGLSVQKRERVADIVHSVVRWKTLYDHLILSRGLSVSAASYVDLAIAGAQADASSFPFEIRYSCSPYVANLLKDHEDWAAYLNQTPPSTLCVNFNKSKQADVIDMLRKENLPVERAVLQTALFTTSASKYSKVIQQRLAHVQDETSQLVSFLSVSMGESIFDYCAGNGGKSLSMASMTKNKKTLYAYELNETKRETLKRRCDEYDAHVSVVDDPSKNQYDVVLVDAPCTGLGAARRNPEVKYIDDAGSLPETQHSILTHAAETVKIGGMLFYAVCTITPEETTQVIQSFLKNKPFTVCSWEDVTYAEYLLKNDYGAFTNLPRGDLFFLSILKRDA